MNLKCKGSIFIHSSNDYLLLAFLIIFSACSNPVLHTQYCYYGYGMENTPEELELDTISNNYKYEINLMQRTSIIGSYVIKNNKLTLLPLASTCEQIETYHDSIKTVYIEFRNRENGEAVPLVTVYVKEKVFTTDVNGIISLDNLPKNNIFTAYMLGLDRYTFQTNSYGHWVISLGASKQLIDYEYLKYKIKNEKLIGIKGKDVLHKCEHSK